VTSTRERPATETAGGILAGPFRATTAGIVLVISFIAFETMAVATALPTAVAELRGLAWYGWSFTALLVASVVGMVAAGELTDRTGGRRPLVAGIAVFLAGLAVSGLAGTMLVFVLGRAMQGLGIGLVIVVTYVIIGEAYPEGLRPRVFGAISAAWVLPALVGPVVAGALAEGVGWRWVFLGLLPPFLAGSALLVPTVRRLRPPADPAPLRPARWAAAVLTAAGIATLQSGAQRADRGGAVAAAVGLVLLAAGLRVLLPRGTVRLRRGVPAVIAFRGMLAGSLFSVESLVPLTLTVVHGYSATAAGLPLTLSALGWSSASWWQGRHPQVPRHLLVRTGFTAVAVAAAGMAVVAQPATPPWLVYLLWPVAGAGAGLVMPSVGVLLLALTPEAQRGANSSALQISDSTTSALCIGLGGALVAASERGVLGLPAAVAIQGTLMVGLALTGALLAGRARAPR
jgi:MFS family permease